MKPAILLGLSPEIEDIREVLYIDLSKPTWRLKSTQLCYCPNHFRATQAILTKLFNLDSEPEE